jgi:hypothetical protein
MLLDLYFQIRMKQHLTLILMITDFEYDLYEWYLLIQEILFYRTSFKLNIYVLYIIYIILFLS